LRKNKNEVDADAQRKQPKSPRATKKTKKRKKQETEKGQRFRVFKELAKLVSLEGWTETQRKGKRGWMMGNYLSAVIHISRKLLFLPFIHPSFIHPSVSVSRCILAVCGTLSFFHPSSIPGTLWTSVRS
jgi:hypothetical protein